MKAIVTGLEELGLSLYGDFLTPENELALLPKLLAPVTFQRKETKDRTTIQRYGDCRAYSNCVVSSVIPPHFVELGGRLLEQNLIAYVPDSVTVNEYAPGDVIPAHIDAPIAGRVITVLSLASPATMVFKLAGTSAIHSVVLPPRSVVQMRRDIRFKWTHEILPVAAQRYSVVFRCSCDTHDLG
jgi:alkylated DNA repair protein alkB family protein 8